MEIKHRRLRASAHAFSLYSGLDPKYWVRCGSGVYDSAICRANESTFSTIVSSAARASWNRFISSAET
ncbi:hypothetical protein PGC08_12620 [Brevibacterium sp. BDJS002]|uniref:hypothetical protein n=1 Tax=Brevibacterium sp. BDJS002 TaxID=3020906 RepID=UPI002307F45F|nr:hypothetical protein [Brevibacterium sp. BDJS002]WCE38850.1 hypothetical protein PGC08_12620 [Brevibacterium sp. BDJS002]